MGFYLFFLVIFWGLACIPLWAWRLFKSHSAPQWVLFLVSLITAILALKLMVVSNIDCLFCTLGNEAIVEKASQFKTGTVFFLVSLVCLFIPVKKPS